MALRFGHIEILSRAPETAVAFYRDVLGFTVTVEQGDGLTWLQKGELEILVRPGDNRVVRRERYEDAPTGFVLYSDDIAADLAALGERGLVVRGTVDSEKCYTFTDPDGNWFQLVDPYDH